jgi:hypothetical protein
VSPHGGLRYV